MNESNTDDLLLEFVHERDVACPRCGYNLRNLSRPVCPECEEPLRLHVTAYKPNLLWLLLTLAPGAFCAIAFLIFLFVAIVIESPPPYPEVILTVSFIFLSGLFAVLLAVFARKFIRLSASAQALWMLIVWSINLLAFAIFVLNA